MAELKSGDRCLVFGHLFTFLATTSETGGRYSIYEDHVPPAGGPPPHTHPDEELFYIIEGEFEFVLNDLSKPFRVGAGQLVRIPSAAPHTFRNVGSTMGRMLTIMLPGNLEHYFRDTAVRVNPGTELPDLNQPTDFSKLDLRPAFAMAPVHNIEFLVPQTA